MSLHTHLGAVVAVIACAGCPATSSGTITLDLTTAPGSALLDSVTRLRVTLTEPRQVVIADRTNAGFQLALDVEATGNAGAIVVEGFDSVGDLVATGQSPAFPIAALTARVVIYMARPLSIERAPVSLPARRNVSTAALPFGVMFAGGRDASTDAPSDAVAIYNAFDHGIAGGLALPAPRDGVIVAPGSAGIVFLFGGRDAQGVPTGTTWRFDTNVAPSGSYFELGDAAGLARADQAALPIALDQFVITGAPCAELAARVPTPRSDLGDAVDGAGALDVVTPLAVLVDAQGALSTLRAGVRAPIAGELRPGAGVAAMPDRRLLAIGGGPADAPTARSLTEIAGDRVRVVPDVLLEGRVSPSVATTSRHIVVAGGAPNGGVTILDAATLARVEPLVGASGPIGSELTAVALANDQVLILDGDGVIWLFTPPPPPLD